MIYPGNGSMLMWQTFSSLMVIRNVSNVDEPLYVQYRNGDAHVTANQYTRFTASYCVYKPRKDSNET